MTSIVAAYARQRLADMEELNRDLGRSRNSARRSRPTTTRRTARSWLAPGPPGRCPRSSWPPDPEPRAPGGARSVGSQPVRREAWSAARRPMPPSRGAPRGPRQPAAYRDFLRLPSLAGAPVRRRGAAPGDRRRCCCWSLATVVALVWANSPWTDIVRRAPRPPRRTRRPAPRPDARRRGRATGLLAIFFFVAGLELKRELVARARCADPPRRAAGRRGARRDGRPGR